MEDRRSWLRENWRIGFVLVLILGLAMFLRTYFVYSEFAPAGYWTGGGDYSGGSDPFYWERALLFSYHTGKEISWDYAMNYPIGFPDVRPPLFDWFNLLAGYLASPAFGGNAWNAMVWMLNMNAAIFGVLSIIPTYLIGKEAFNRRAGILAALLLAISAAALARSHATIAVHDSWTLFFVICAFYFYLRALKTLNRKRWVDNWFQRSSVRAGLRTFLQENRKSVLYAALAGLSVGVTALSWQGWAYVPVILVLIYVIEVLLDRIRNQDAMGVTILFLIILAVPLLISFPWYAVRNLIKVWWDVPFYLFLVAAVLGVVFTVTRDYPWTIVIPGTFIAGGVGLVIGFTVNPSLLYAFYSGAGYFVKNKVYQTIAEAQEPGMSELILSFGMFTFGIGLIAIGYLIWQVPKRNNPAYTMLVLWTFGALFMAFSAARFIFNAAPVMAVATGYALDLILTRMGFEEMKRTYRSLSEGSWRNALRKSVKPRHVIVVALLVLIVLLPNVWFAVDSGIPYEQKSAYDKQIHAALPSFLQAPGYASVGSSNTFYLGAFGYSLPKSTDYFPAAYAWLSTQDANLPLDSRPAVMAWWDYGFEITERGGHPVVADPFQNGYGISGQFILAQNESMAISLMAVRLLEGDYRAHYPNLSPPVVQVLQQYGIDPGQVTYAFRNGPALISVILGNPNLYGLWDSTLTAVNTPYIYLETLLSQKLTEDRIVTFYADVSTATDTSIGYFMVDTRLFPLSASNTGIFYAPAKLSDHRTLDLANGQVLPYDFFQITANTTNPTATNIPIQFVAPTSTIRAESIAYQSMFYDSMFYRAYVGYSPSVVGSTDKGIPGMDQALSGYSPMPAWNLTHFRVVYRTTYYNPYADPSNHTTAWRAVNYDEAQALQAQITAKKIQGVVDQSMTTDIQNGAVILRYYPGAYVNGTVSVNGVPVPGAWVTVTDELGTPHGVTKTDAQGHYSLLAPFGNVTIAATTGTLNGLTLLGSNTLATKTFPVTVDQAMRVNQDLNGDGVPDWLIAKDIAVPSGSLRGTVYLDLNHNGVYDTTDLPVAGGTLRFTAQGVPLSQTTTTDPAGIYAFSGLATGTYSVTLTTRGHTLSLSSVRVNAGANANSLIVPFQTVSGLAVYANGTLVPGATLNLTDEVNGTAWDATANGNGSFSFAPVLAGNYTLVATQGANASLPLHFLLRTSAFSSNVTLLPSGQVTGTTELFGQPLAYATVQFQSTATNTIVASVTSDADGRFRIGLPAGDWNVNGVAYQGTNLYATLGRVTVAQGVTTGLDPGFTSGVRVSGRLTSGSTSQTLNAHIGFVGSAGEWWVQSSANNQYLLYLPQGSYSVVASASSVVYTTSVNLAASRSLNLPLWTATALAGSVYWDINGNHRFDTSEGIPGARIALTDNTGALTVGYTDVAGSFTVNLLDNRTYSGTVSANGFAPFHLNASTPSEIGSGVGWTLDPVPVQLVGSVYLNGTPLLNRALALHAVAIGGGAVSANGTTYSDGSYSLALNPGTYLLEVDENVTAGNGAWRYQNLRTDVAVLPVAQSLAYDNLTIVARARVKGNVTLAGVAGAASVTFHGPDDASLEATSTGFSVYLQAGTYSVRADRSTATAQYAVLLNATVPLTGNLSLALAPATQLSGLVSYAGSALTKPMELTFVRKEGGSFQALTTSTGTYSANLVAGNYTVSLDTATSEITDNVTRYYVYSFQGTLTVPPASNSLNYDVGTSRSLDNTTVSGLVSVGGGGVDASLSFIAQSGGALGGRTTSAVNGAYLISLAPGTYVVYVTRSVGTTAFLGTLTVNHVAALGYPIALQPAFDLSGVVLDPAGNRMSAAVNVTGAATLTLVTDAQGSYASVLPQGSYAVVASRSQVEQGVTVDYQGSVSFDLSADAVVNLQLGRVDKHAVHVTWDASQNRTVNPGGSVTYTVVVQNLGNVQDTFTLRGNAAGWTFTFFPTTVSLNYGTAPNSAPVTVTIQSPPDALVSHSAISVTATSTADSNAADSALVTVGITRVRGLSLQANALSGTFDGTFLNYTVTVRNTGNDAEKVDLSIQNPSNVIQSGWSPGLAMPGSTTLSTPTLAGVNVSANTTQSVKLVLRLAGANGGTTVALNVAAEGAPSVSSQAILTAVLPQLTTPAGIGVSGRGISAFLPPNDVLLAVLVGAVAAIGAGWFLTRRRR